LIKNLLANITEAMMILFDEWQDIESRLAGIMIETEKFEISPVLVALLIAAEDHRYGIHPGVDPISLCRAFWRTLVCGMREGGSTIAMQLVRVVTGRYENTISRKFAEIYLAIRLTRHVRESDIPKLYLTIAYYGWRMNGLEQASARLKINPSAVSLSDAANVIARLKYPEPGCPTIERYSKIASRSEYIIKRHNKIFRSLISFEHSMSNSNGSL
jgi:membrane carboxypeptidase/penicillin-binding protein PbpC